MAPRYTMTRMTESHQRKATVFDKLNTVTDQRGHKFKDKQNVVLEVLSCLRSHLSLNRSDRPGELWKSV